MAPCNCGKNKKIRPFGPSTQKVAETRAKGAKDSYVLRTATGTQTFGSELEAQAAKRRAGGGSIVRRPRA